MRAGAAALGTVPHTWTAAVGIAVRTAGTCACVSILWSLWGSPGVTVWVRAWAHADRYTAIGGVAVLLCVAGARVVLEAWPGRRQSVSPVADRPSWLRNAVLLCVVPLAVMSLAAELGARNQLPDFGLGRQNSRLDRELIIDALETGDSLVPQEGAEELDYHRRLTTLDEGNRRLMEMLLGRFLPPAPKYSAAPMMTTKDFRFEWLKPLASSPAYQTDDFRTNRWGMRDRDYTLAKPADTRIALLGSSLVMDYAMPDSEVSDTLVETRLNDQAAAGHHFEMLNFGQAGSGPVEEVSMLTLKDKPFLPDIVLFVSHLEDLDGSNYRLRHDWHAGPIPFDAVRRIIQVAHVSPDTADGVAERRLKPLEPAHVAWSYRQMVQGSRAMGAVPVFFFIPAPCWERPLTPRRLENADTLVDLAKRAGCAALIDGRHTYDGYAPDALFTAVSPHSNALAHSVIADALSKALTLNPNLPITCCVVPQPGGAVTTGSHVSP